MLKKLDCELDSDGSRLNPVMGSCKPSVSKEGVEFLHQLSEFHFYGGLYSMYSVFLLPANTHFDLCLFQSSNLTD
jgi:hypothetical protein